MNIREGAECSGRDKMNGRNEAELVRWDRVDRDGNMMLGVLK